MLKLYVRERQRERQRETETETEGQRDRETERKEEENKMEKKKWKKRRRRKYNDDDHHHLLHELMQPGRCHTLFADGAGSKVSLVTLALTSGQRALGVGRTLTQGITGAAHVLKASQEFLFLKRQCVYMEHIRGIGFFGGRCVCVCVWGGGGGG